MRTNWTRRPIRPHCAMGCYIDLLRAEGGRGASRRRRSSLPGDLRGVEGDHARLLPRRPGDPAGDGRTRIAPSLGVTAYLDRLRGDGRGGESGTGRGLGAFAVRLWPCRCEGRWKLQ